MRCHYTWRQGRTFQGIELRNHVGRQHGSFASATKVHDNKQAALQAAVSGGASGQTCQGGVLSLPGEILRRPQVHHQGGVFDPARR
jgi:hypothetical protein